MLPCCVCSRNLLLLCSLLLLWSYTNAFVPSLSTTTTSRSAPRPLSATAVSSSSSSLNPFKRLPWNVQKEREREARRLKQERNALHRELGIAEDATYEEIVQATDNLIAAAGSDLKAKVKIEVAKDKILQIRLNERMAGLTTLTKEARAQSTYEADGVDDTVESAKSKREDEDDESTGPKWTRGLIVKPDEKHLSYQIKLWGVLTAIGLGLPPVQGYMGKFNWLICVAQLIYRGMPAEERERGGMGLSFSGGGGGGGHKKLSFALGLGIWAVGSFFIYALMPTWVKGQRWEGSMVYLLQNLLFLLASCYLQPYKGGK